MREAGKGGRNNEDWQDGRTTSGDAAMLGRRGGQASVHTHQTSEQATQPNEKRYARRNTCIGHGQRTHKPVKHLSLCPLLLYLEQGFELSLLLAVLLSSSCPFTVVVVVVVDGWWPKME